jgi:hypothetical protein
MRYDNRNYPHPVLGISDDIQGSFNGNITVKSDHESTIIYPIFTLRNKTIEDLLNTRKAYLMVHLYCRGTMFRESFKVYDLLTGSIRIPTERLSGETEVDIFVCAEEDLKGYRNPEANILFEDTAFDIQKGFLLAYGGKGKFYANKSPEKLKAISSFMRIKCGDYINGPFKIDYSENKFLTIELSRNDFNTYHLLTLNSEYWSILHSSIVFPALIEVVNLMNNDESGISDMRESQWYSTLSDILEKTEGNSTIEKVQKILDLPLNRTLIDLDQEE